MKAAKTFKREIAILFAIFLFGIGLAGLWLPPAMEVLSIVVYPFITFVGMCFGLDSYAKQIKPMK